MKQNRAKKIFLLLVKLYFDVIILIMMLLCARDSNIQSFAYIWLNKGNQNEFFTYPKIKWLDGGLEPPTSGLPAHCSTTWANLTHFHMLLIAYMKVACFYYDVVILIMMFYVLETVIFKVLRALGLIKEVIIQLWCY